MKSIAEMDRLTVDLVLAVRGDVSRELHLNPPVHPTLTDVEVGR